MKLLAGLLVSTAGMVTAYAAQAACDNGIYGIAGREIVAINNPPPSDAAAAARYTFLDGRRGDVNRSGSPVQCERGTLRVQDVDGKFSTWEKIPLTVTPTHFSSHHTELSGVLIEALNPKGEPPLVVNVHGSEKTPVSTNYYPYMLAAQGITVFAYDKRGTGASGGDYTQNFNLLGDDAAAAMREARRLAKGRYSRAGFFGGSQGGWVAPLAAKLSHADFVAVGFGLVMSPLEEDQEQVVSELRFKHYDAAAIKRAHAVTDATGAVMASHFTRGFDTLAQVKKRYANTPWLHTIEGEFTGDVLADDEADLRRTGAARLDNLNIIWNYDATAVIRALNIPQLWVFAGEDREAPGDLTRTRLTALVHAGKPIDLYVFPHTDHGMYEFVEDKDGTRHITRITNGYFRLLGDWIKQDAKPPYGHGERIR